MTRGAWIAPLLVVSVLAFGGATAHSASPACTTAKEKVAAATKAVTRAKRALRRAKTPSAKARARRGLKKAKRRRASALAEQKMACAVQDLRAPAPPTLDSTSPASPAEDTAPEIKGTAEPGSTVRIYSDPACAGPAAATGSAEAFAAGGLTVNVAANSTTVFRATATDRAGNTSPCSPDTVEYVQRPPNQPPVFPAQTIKATQTNQYTVVSGQLRLTAHTVTLTISPGATDPDGDPITYTWEASNGTITGDGLSATWVRVVANYAIVPGTATLTASDGRGGIAQYVFQ